MNDPGRTGFLTRARTAKWLRPGLTVLLLVTFGLAYLLIPPVKEETNQAVRVLASGDAGALRDYILSYGAWAPVVSAGLMVLQALLAFLPSFVLAFANGLAFGVFWGGMLSLTSAALAAAISFGIAHALGRTPVEAMIGKQSLGSADKWFVRYGAYAVFVARLIPVVSFDAISYAAGLTRMSFFKFLLATTAGMTPATFVYSYLGERAPQYMDLLLVAFGLIIAGGVVTALVRRERARRRSRRQEPR
ncbi:MAG: TVP38/TMEM64 family protein [Rubrobacteraceae bacterium]